MTVPSAALHVQTAKLLLYCEQLFEACWGLLSQESNKMKEINIRDISYLTHLPHGAVCLN